ncbi:MAG: DUF4855 domain-containing protein [Clostridia bacterium]|nr:DUF4855 domain-containing protein [Clostridia bacterium]
MGWYRDFEIEAAENAPLDPEATKERRNLILGLPIYGISANGLMEENALTEYFNTPDDKPMLTDGKYASAPDYLDPGYFHFTRGVGRTVIFRLPYLSAVSGACVHALKQDEVAARLPRKVDILVSPNGRDWQKLGTIAEFYCDEPKAQAKAEITFDKAYKALYAAFRIDTVGHVWLDELELFGCTDVSAAADITAGDKLGAEINYVNRYPDYSDFLGVHNVLLSYHCAAPEKVGESRLGLITEEQYLPYVAYIKDGRIQDTLFDSFLYLPYSNFTYSKWYKCAEGWKYYVNNIFEENCNLQALENTAARVGKELGRPDYKVQVFFSILHTNVRYGDHPDKFGDLDGDGVDEDMTSLADREKAIKWCIDEQVARYKAGSYPHCELSAFYWFEEDINYADKYEFATIAFARDYLHSLGYKLFWIPYFQASGFQDWKEAGFDIACMQPNYAFRDTVPRQRLYDNARLTKQLGMCYEMEIGGFDAHHVDKFRDYMDCGAETGYMHSVKMYYQGGVPGEFYKAYKCDDPSLHALYDDLYAYCKEKYVSRRDR